MPYVCRVTVSVLVYCPFPFRSICMSGTDTESRTRSLLSNLNAEKINLLFHLQMLLLTVYLSQINLLRFAEMDYHTTT